MKKKMRNKKNMKENRDMVEDVLDENPEYKRQFGIIIIRLAAMLCEQAAEKESKERGGVGG